MVINSYKSLLLDLDGTLLDIDMRQFIPAYTRWLSGGFAPYLDADAFAENLLKSIQIMVDNEDPEIINEDIFFEDFCRRLGQPYEIVYPLFDRFYRHEFDRLRSLSKPRPYAGTVVRAAREKGLKLTLATNPIFPLTAITSRLKWAGLSASDFDFITTVENMHFCKPNEKYYLEIAAVIDCPPELCLMAGNDVQEDLTASTVGMATFLVNGCIINRENEKPVSTYRGGLQDLASLFTEKMPEK